MQSKEMKLASPLYRPLSYPIGRSNDLLPERDRFKFSNRFCDTGSVQQRGRVSLTNPPQGADLLSHLRG